MERERDGDRTGVWNRVGGRIIWRERRMEWIKRGRDGERKCRSVCVWGE